MMDMQLNVTTNVGIIQTFLMAHLTLYRNFFILMAKQVSILYKKKIG